MTAAYQDALEMLDAFASIGAQRFDITVTDMAQTQHLNHQPQSNLPSHSIL